MHYSSAATRRFVQSARIEPNPRQAFAFDGGSVRASFSWHHHPHHQLIYAREGSLMVESVDRRHLLPPLRAGFVAAATSHRTVAGTNGKRTRSISIFFEPKLVPGLGPGVHTMHASPLLRELIDEVKGWGPDHLETPLSQSCFRALAQLCLKWIADPTPFWLPRSDHPGIAEALRYVEKNLRSVDESSAAKAAAMSERTFRRHFTVTVGLTWREYLLRARMMWAADLLGGTRRTVADIAWETGYRSVSAFTEAFQAFSGHAPGVYRRSR